LLASFSFRKSDYPGAVELGEIPSDHGAVRADNKKSKIDTDARDGETLPFLQKNNCVG
jgi:hypothetical protein